MNKKIGNKRISIFNEITRIYHELLQIRHNGTAADFDFKIEELKEVLKK